MLFFPANCSLWEQTNKKEEKVFLIKLGGQLISYEQQQII